ncbi:hypothetical protein FRC10_004294 [Ceratobasidium sp. 414]|nr:hypothetical protein FRC10_004294 [Ceratobasidium sp. 414]
MSETWKQPFQLGVKAFRGSKYEDALKHFTRSIELDSTNASVFDSRAATYQSLSKFREALADTRKCISLQPERYVVQGYYRSARIFLAMSKHDRCIQMIGEARRRMNPSDASHARKAQEMDEMEATARKGLEAAEAHRRNHVDPLKKLPLELLVEICRIAVGTSDAEAGLRGASHFAVVLGSVCQSLRALVHRTPPLWQSVTFTKKQFSRKSAFWLERLDGCPLYSVTLVDLDLSTILQATTTLASTSPGSWGCLRIEGENADGYIIYEALQAFPLSLHSLSVLCPLVDRQIVFHLKGALASMASVPETQKPGTYTRRISLCTGIVSINAAALPYITHLELSAAQLISSQYDILGQLLYAAPELRSLIIKPRDLLVGPAGHTIPDIPELESPGSFRLEQLEVLRLAMIGPTKAHTFSFPKLQVLDLQRILMYQATITFGYLLLGHSLHICPPIREIRLNLVPIDALVFKRVLESFSPTLESLEVSYCGGLDDDFMECFSQPIPGTEHPVCCPRLRDLNFNGIQDLKAGPLVRLIKARLPSSNANNPNPPTPIRNLVIDNCASVDAEALPWMRANVTGALSCVYKSRAEAKGRRRDRNI